MKFDLVFEGGGAKGTVFVGAMEEFLARDHTYDRLLGTSAGAITAALLAVGYTTEEMQAAISEKQDGRSVFDTFLATPQTFEEADVSESAISAFLASIDIPLVPERIEEKLDTWIVKSLLTNPRFRHFFSFVERGGWFSAEHFRTWMEQKLDTGTFRGEPRTFGQMNFAQLFEATGIELTLIAADTTDERMLILNHNTAPQCPVVWGVRMSMSIPLLWQEVEWQPDWGAYRGQEIAGHAIVDGGLLSNFPIELFVSSDSRVTDVMGPKREGKVLGLLIDESLEVADAPPSPGQETSFDLSRLRVAQRGMHLLNTMTLAHDKMVIDAVRQMVVRMPAKSYGTTEFNMSDERRTALVNAGRQAMAQYLDWTEMSGVSFDVSGMDPNARATTDRIATSILMR